MTNKEIRMTLERMATNMLGASMSEKDEKLRSLMMRDYEVLDTVIRMIEPRKPRVEVRKTIIKCGDSEEFEEKTYNVCPNCRNILTKEIRHNAFCNLCGIPIGWGGDDE